ncbi:transcriptional repressor general negative regulator of transcription subunit 4 [Microbotryomycetes sp. JL201]|nr:transcriptional repressor general negative regulator of transcription subunit 4 [Microbotryomycetes sp. JL201]
MRAAWQTNVGAHAGAHRASSHVNHAQFPPVGQHPHHSHQHHGHGSHSARDKLINSTALDRVMAMLDGFEEDLDCPICCEEMDVSDLNFKPCPCGYQICRFCYSHIKDELNNRCPACRSPYDEATVDFKPIKPEELKRVQAAQKLRDKRRKEEQLVFQAKANVKVRHRTQVLVQGMTTKLANEDTAAQLKGSDHFGKHGRVVRLVMAKRVGTVSGHVHPLYQPVNIFVTYRTSHEAANCIANVDGSTTEDGHKLRAAWAVTGYCPTFLRGGKCHNESCLQAHEYGEEVDSNGVLSKDDNLFADADTPRPRSGAMAPRKVDVTLPAAASWASKDGKPTQPPTHIILNESMPPLSANIKAPPPPQQPKAAPKPAAQPTPTKPSSQSRLTKAEAKAAVNAAAGLPVESPRKAAAQPASEESSTTESAEIVEEPQASTSSAALSSTLPAAGDFFTRPPQPQPVQDEFPSIGFGFDEGFSFSFDLPVTVATSKGKSKAFLDSADDGRVDGPAPIVNLGPSSQREPLSNVSDPMAALFPPPLAPTYHGSFDPFAEASSTADRFGHGVFGDVHSASSSPPTSAGGSDERRGSRFGFARRESSHTPSLRAGDLSQAMLRGTFSSSGSSAGRQSPSVANTTSSFAPPGIAVPSRTPSANNSNALFALLSGGGTKTAENGDSMHSSVSSSLWSTGTTNGAFSAAPNFPPGILRAFSSPQASATSSPQLSPRARANLSMNGSDLPSSSGPPGINGHTASGMTRVASGSSMPPGLSLTRGAPIPTASFPLPPPAPKPSNQAGTVVGKDDLLALIAKAQQTSNSKSQAFQPDSHPFFSDPAILNARLASVSPSVSHSSPSPALQALQQQFAQLSHAGGVNGIQAPAGPGTGAAFHSLDSAPLSSPNLFRPFEQQQSQQQQQQQMYTSGAPPGYSLPPPPGMMRQPFPGGPPMGTQGLVGRRS